jgi:dTDP-4-amino-4,6-dideoxygalactose transaminase
MKTLAIHGGKKVRTTPFPAQQGPCLDVFDAGHYLEAAQDVIDSQVLSGYRGNSGPAFWGGRHVQRFETELEQRFGGQAVACNSATSGLWMACNAIGLQPGDEVIVTPWSMSCSATVPLLFGAIPVFADIEPLYFCLDPEDVRRKITDRTKAIIAVDLFGQPCSPELRRIAVEHDLFLIEDAAQAIGSTLNGTPAGLLGDYGIFSFTQGKHLTAGEGGAVMCSNTGRPLSVALARNHAEAVVKDNPKVFGQYQDMVGLNLRMTEMQGALLCEELRRLDGYIKGRRDLVSEIGTVLEAHGLYVGPTRKTATHSYYVLPILFKDEKMGAQSREIAEALRAELMPDKIRLDRGVPVGSGYIDPLYQMPVFQERKHWAFGLQENKGHSGCYLPMTCPVAEGYQLEGFMLTLLHGLPLTTDDTKDVLEAFDKVLTYYGRQ